MLYGSYGAPTVSVCSCSSSVYFSHFHYFIIQETLGYRRHLKIVCLAFLCSPYYEHLEWETTLQKRLGYKISFQTRTACFRPLTDPNGAAALCMHLSLHLIPSSLETAGFPPLSVPKSHHDTHILYYLNNSKYCAWWCARTNMKISIRSWWWPIKQNIYLQCFSTFLTTPHLSRATSYLSSISVMCTS